MIDHTPEIEPGVGLWQQVGADFINKTETKKLWLKPAGVVESLKSDSELYSRTNNPSEAECSD
jgi:hypothetical protein